MGVASRRVGWWRGLALGLFLAGLGAEAQEQTGAEAPVRLELEQNQGLAAAPFTPEIPVGEVPAAASLEARARWGAGVDALQRGLAGFAAGLLEHAVGSGALTREEEAEARLAWTTALIAQGRPAAAREVLVRHPDPDLPAVRLRRAAIAWQELDRPGAVALARDLVETDLPAADRPWFHLLDALLAESAGDLEAAEAALQRARDLAVDPGLNAEMELLLLRGRVQSGQSTRVEADELVARTRANPGTPLGFRAARLAAPALVQAGSPAEALALLDEQLRYPGVEEGGNGDQIRLLYAQLAGPDSAAGRQRLREILRRPAVPLRQRAALAQLAGQAALSPEASAELRMTLDELLGRSPAPALLDVFLLQRARLNLFEQRYDEAEEDASRLLERVPGSALVGEAERLRAYVALVRVPPRWRTAADLLGRLRDRLPPGPERRRFGRLTADCFFLEGDFANAAAAYTAVLRDPAAEDRSVLLYQQVLAYLRAGALDAAQTALEAEQPGSGDDVWRWRAEWNLLAAWRAEGRAGLAFTRLENLLARTGLEALPGSLRLRLRWLELELWVEAGRGDAGPRVEALLAALAGPEGEELAPAARSELAAHALFLRARARYEADDAVGARDVLAELRRRYPGLEPTIVSHLLQARFQVLDSRLDDAQRSLATLRETYPESPHAPRALYEAALILEQRGLAATWQEAIGLLEELVNRYPQSGLVFVARLKQADLTRRLGNFGAAQLIYEGLLNRWPEHPERWRAELGRADTFVAQASANPERLADAMAIYERVVDLPSVPVDVRIEAGGKWGAALVRQGRAARAEGVYFLIFERFLTAEGGSAPGPVGRYWLARMVLELGELAERAGRYAEAIETYRLIEQHGLPGLGAADARRRRLTAVTP